jgi:hypothetical protein
MAYFATSQMMTAAMTTTTGRARFKMAPPPTDNKLSASTSCGALGAGAASPVAVAGWLLVAMSPFKFATN